MDTILLLDISGSMAGAKIKELKNSIIAFIDLLEKLNFGERVAIISFGAKVQVISQLTQNYSRLKSIVSSLNASGGTPMAEALLHAIDQLKYTRAVEIGPVTLMPRVILFTDGEPDDRTKVGVVAKAMGEAGLPVVCIGVVGCDRDVMSGLAKLSGGMFIMADDIALLQLFFIRQVLLIAYVMEVKEQLQNLYNRELLRSYLESKTQHAVSDEELDGFIYFLKHVIKTKEDQGGQVREYNDKGCYCCCCLCTFRNVVTSFLLLLSISIICWSGYALHIALTAGFPGVHDGSVNNFGIASLFLSLIFGCCLSIHLVYLRKLDNDVDSMLWLVEVLCIIFMAIPNILLFAAVFRSDGTYVFPSAVTIVSVLGACCLCNCCVRFFSKE